ncbi:YesL family protein [Clostridium carnis]
MNDIFNLENIFDIFNYIFWFFLLNLFFMILNFPLVAFILFVGISNAITYLPLFLLCLIPVAPALTALLYCTGKLIRNKSLNIFKDFFRGLKINFKQSLILWIPELILIFVLHSNIKFFSTSQYSIITTCIFSILLIVLLCVTPYIFLLISRFSMKSLDIVRAAFILAFTRPILTVCNVLILGFVLIVFEIIPGTTALFISSILAFLLSFSNKALLNELEGSSNDKANVTTDSTDDNTNNLEK